MKIRSLEDIEREKHDEKRDKLTDEINKVIEGVFKKPKKEESIFWTIGKILLGLVLLMIVVNLVLGNIWLLKFFWGELFWEGFYKDLELAFFLIIYTIPDINKLAITPKKKKIIGTMTAPSVKEAPNNLSFIGNQIIKAINEVNTNPIIVDIL